ncbi:protein of unknown function [Xenorhabdus nematophila AN6/1]|nr:protein of unknown function [Xenorhabdus nematophila AN6/1]
MMPKVRYRLLSMKLEKIKSNDVGAIQNNIIFFLLNLSPRLLMKTRNKNCRNHDEKINHPS